MAGGNGAANGGNGIGGQLLQGIGKGARRRGGNRPGTFGGNDLGQPASQGGHDRKAERQRLHHHIRNAIAITIRINDRWHHQGMHLLHEAADALARHGAGKAEAGRQPQRDDLPFELRPQRAIAGNNTVDRHAPAAQFGGHSILVQGVPASLKNWNEGRLLLDILDDLAWDDKPIQENQVDLLASYACHAAVRAGEPLTIPEMQNLVDQLFATDQPLSCPHGRPTLIQFTLGELEKRFGRS